MQHKVELIRRRLKSAAAELDAAQLHGEAMFKSRQLDGGKMRNLDDAQQWLNDTVGALNEFLTFKG